MKNSYLETLEPVWRGLKHVSVNEEKIQELAQKVKKENLTVPAWAEPNIQPVPNCSLREWIDFVCWTNTINFAFTNFRPPYNKFIIEYPKGISQRGAFAMEAAFTRAFEEGLPVFNAAHMSNITQMEVEHIFRPIDADHGMPMILERWQIFREIGKVLSDVYGGYWLNLFERAGWRAFDDGAGIVDQLVDNFPSFNDMRLYRGCILEFHKRAQLLVIMYQGRAQNSLGKFPLIADVDDIGPIADYEVPKVLRFLGVLKYSPAFERAIINREVIPPNDEREVENRLAMCYAMKRICDEAKVSILKLDSYIWHMGREAKSPHILVPTTDY